MFLKCSFGFDNSAKQSTSPSESTLNKKTKFVISSLSSLVLWNEYFCFKSDGARFICNWLEVNCVKYTRLNSWSVLAVEKNSVCVENLTSTLTDSEKEQKTEKTRTHHHSKSMEHVLSLELFDCSTSNERESEKESDTSRIA